MHNYGSCQVDHGVRVVERTQVNCNSTFLKWSSHFDKYILKMRPFLTWEILVFLSMFQLKKDL
jgi:hypothetical protein